MHRVLGFGRGAARGQSVCRWVEHRETQPRAVYIRRSVRMVSYSVYLRRELLGSFNQRKPIGSSEIHAATRIGQCRACRCRTSAAKRRCRSNISRSTESSRVVHDESLCLTIAHAAGRGAPTTRSDRFIGCPGTSTTKRVKRRFEHGGVAGDDDDR